MNAELFQSKVFIVTGGAAGIGLGTVQQLYEYGAYVYALDVCKEPPSAFRTFDGDRVIYIENDVRDYHKCKATVDSIKAKHGIINGLVNNAGVCPPEGELPEEALYHRIVDTNLGGTFNMGSAVLAHMRDQGNGVIVNVGSTSCLVGKNRLPLYASSKHAMLGLTRSWALDFAKYGIRVNCVGPGATDTAMARGPLQTVMGPRYGGNKTDDELLKLVASSIPLGRIGTPQDVANAINFLLSDLSSFITGQVLCVGGGS